MTTHSNEEFDWESMFELWPADRLPTLPRNRPPYAVRFESASVVVLDRGYRTLAEINLTSPEVRGLLRAMLEDNGEHCHLDWDDRHGLQYAAQFGMLSALATIYPTKWHTRSEAFHRPEVQR